MSDTQILSQEDIKEEYNGVDVVGYLAVGQEQYEVKRGCNKIGRDPDLCSIVLTNNTVSKLHSVIESDGIDDIFIYDTGSTNKTKLGNKFIKPHCRYKLDSGAIITLGTVILKFSTSKESEKFVQKPFVKNIVSSNFGDVVSNFDDIFDLETQVNFSQTNHTCDKLSVNPKSEQVQEPKTSAVGNEKHLEMIKSMESLNQTKITTISTSQCINYHKRNLKSMPPVQQVLNLTNCDNSNIYSIETQCQITLSENANNLTNNENNQIDFFEIDNQTAEAFCRQASMIHVVEKNNDEQSKLHSVKLKSQSSLEKDANILLNMPKIESEKELLNKDTKIRECYEENFNVENIEEKMEMCALSEDVNGSGMLQMQNNQQHSIETCQSRKSMKNMHFLEKTKSITAEFTISQKLQNPSEIFNGENSDKKMGDTNINSGKISQAKLSSSPEKYEIEKEQIDGIKQMEQIHPLKYLNDNLQNKNNQGRKITSETDNSGSDTDSYLEITLDEAIEEKINNYKFNQLMRSEERKPMYQEGQIIEKQLIQSSKEVLKEQEKDKEYPTFEPGDDNTSDSSIVSLVFEPSETTGTLSETVEKKISSNSPHIKSNDCFSLFPSQPLVKSQDLIGSVTSNVVNSNTIVKKYDGSEEIFLWEEILGLTKDTPITLTKDCGAYVPESPDRQALSDYDIIEDTPNIRCLKPNWGTKLEPVLNTTSLNRDKIPSRELVKCFGDDDAYDKIDSEGSDFSNSSYAFEVGNKTENDICRKDGKNDNKYAVVCSSDSDTNDFIEVTPPPPGFSFKSRTLTKDKLSSNATRLMFDSGANNCQNAITSPVNCVPDDESSDSGSFSSVKVPSPGVLEETLTKIMEKAYKSNSQTISEETNRFREGSVSPIQEKTFCQAKPEYKSPPVTHLGKRIRSLDNKNDAVSAKKYKHSNQPEEVTRSLKAHEIAVDNEKLQFCTKSQLLTGSEIRKLPDCHDVSASTSASPSAGKTEIKSTEILNDLTVKVESNEKRNLLKTSRTRRNLRGRKGHDEEKSETSLMLSKSSISDNLIETGRRFGRVMTRRQTELNRGKNNLDSRYSRDLEENGLSEDTYFANGCVNVVFTGLESKFLDKIIQQLGGKKTDDVRSGQVLVTDRVRRTVKFLCAIGLCLPIASPHWLLMSKKKNSFINPWNYILKCEESEEKWDFDLKCSLESAKKRKLLNGFSVFATESVKPPVADILYIAECCGGVPLRHRPDVWSKKTIVISCLEDKKSWPHWKFRSTKVVHYEFILSGVLQQRLDFKTYKLR